MSSRNFNAGVVAHTALRGMFRRADQMIYLAIGLR